MQKTQWGIIRNKDSTYSLTKDGRILGSSFKLKSEAVKHKGFLQKLFREIKKR
jgi:hypothetical protein